MKRKKLIPIFLLITSAMYAGSSALRPVEMTISPSEIAKAAQQIRLSPTAEEQADADAVSLYEKAIKSLPADFQSKQFSDWRSLSPEQLPVEQVESALKKLKPTLDLLTQATRSKQCNWPFIKPEQARQQMMDDLSKYRQLAFVLDVQAKLQIAQGQYDKASQTIKTGLTMAKHLGDAPTLVQGMVGIAIAALNISRVEQWVQTDNAPNLYRALGDIGRPVVDVTKAIKIETDNLKNYNALLRSQFEKQLKPAHDRVLMQMNHVERKTSALQCIEALRLYAGLHDGKFPDKLSDITEVSVPVDPVTKKPFSFTRTGSRAVLEVTGAEGSDGRDAVRYELNLKK